MTKALAWTLAVLAVALAAPPATAHGAAPPREVDTRVLLDDDGLVSHGGCLEGECAAAGGLDLLALDVREAWLGEARAIQFRMVYQTEGDAAGRALALTLTANGTERTLTATSADGTAFGGDFDLVEGPFDVFDGHPKAVDGWVLLSTLGVAPGDELTGITLASLDGEDPDDVMPGGWYANGAEVPHVPEDPDPGHVTEAMLPGTYALKGPAPLVRLEATPTLVDLNRSANVTLRLTNLLASTAQAVDVTIPGVAGAFAGADAATVNLDAGATRLLTLTWPTDAPSGNATLVAASDLRARAVQEVQVVARPAAPDADPASGEGDGKGKGAPLTLLAPAAVALAALAARRRR